MASAALPRLGLGPLLYLWDGPKWRDFYFRIADEAPIDYVVLGEIVCSKRLHFIEPHFAEVVERLEAAGKAVRLASLALVTLERESRYLRSMIHDADRPVEANDLAAIGLLNGRPHTIGPLINVYNTATARLLAARGATHICLPPELPMASVADIVAGAPDVGFEVFAFGRVPLAISARCAHARAKGHTKDNCQFVCGEDPDGLPLTTLDRQPFLALNGVQTVSHTCQALLGELPELAAAGVWGIRLSPQDCDMVSVARLYDDKLRSRIDSDDAVAKLRALYSGGALSNGFHHDRLGAAWVPRLRHAAQEAGR